MIYILLKERLNGKLILKKIIPQINKPPVTFKIARNVKRTFIAIDIFNQQIIFEPQK